MQDQTAVHNSQLQFQQLLEKLPAGAYTCDRDGLITYFNSHATRIWGRAPKLNDPADRFCGSFKLFSSDGIPLAHDQCWMARTLENDQEHNGHEIIIERPDGQRLTVLAHANPVRDETGTLVGAVNVLIDIDERKRAEDLLRDADRSKNEFLATLAHELRNPLAPIRNAVHILHLEAAPSPEVQWALAIIDRQISQMTRLIDDLLDIARITGDKLELRKQQVGVEEVFRAAIETSRPLIDGFGHELIVTLPGQPIYFEGDLTRLAQVVANLLNNAAKYTECGGRIWLTGERQGDDAVITVRDNGIGIPAKMLPCIFEMFTQVDRSLERSPINGAPGGLGIGLTLVRRLVRMHGGTIRARSDGPGKGSEFVVRLPMLVELGQTQLDSSRVDREDKQTPAATSLRILVVDDNHDSAASLDMLLRLTGNEVHVAHDGLEAVGMAHEFRPNLVLLDIGLPQMNGYDVARRIRQQPWGNDVALIALTGWGEEVDRNRSKEAGFDHHLVKPVDPAALLALLNSLQQKDQQSAA